jgi:hypothetical protein
VKKPEGDAAKPVGGPEDLEGAREKWMGAPTKPAGAALEFSRAAMIGGSHFKA